jgi:hypothetical protein
MNKISLIVVLIVLMGGLVLYLNNQKNYQSEQLELQKQQLELQKKEAKKLPAIIYNPENPFNAHTSTPIPVSNSVPFVPTVPTFKPSPIPTYTPYNLNTCYTDIAGYTHCY